MRTILAINENEELAYYSFCKSQRTNFKHEEPKFPLARFAISVHTSSGIGINTVVHDMITGDFADITDYGAW